MRIILFYLSIFIVIQTNFAQTEKIIPSEKTNKKPLQYFGHLELNGLIPLKTAPTPNHLAIETKYWLNKSKYLKSSLGFGWQMGFNEGYAKNNVDFSIDNLVGNELSYLYNYLSVRYKLIQSRKTIRPYAELGGGWLLITDKFVDRPLNPDFDPDHPCDESEYLRNTTLIRAQSHLALDAEIGLNFQVNKQVSLNLGIGGIITQPMTYLKKGYLPNTIETRRQVAPQSYAFQKRALHSTNLKIGIALLLFNDPNIIREKSSNDCFLIDDFSSSDSCN